MMIFSAPLECLLYISKEDSMKRNLILSLLGVAIFAGAALAQNPPPQSGQPQPQDIKQKFAQANKANAAAVRQYTWKSRTELKLKGESKNVKLEQVRYDSNGQLQKTPLGGSPQGGQQQQSAGGRGGRLKQKVIENKKEEFGEMMKGLGQLVTSYTHIPPEKMQAFIQNASVSQGQGPDAGTIQIAGKNALQSGDSMSIWVNKTSLMFHRVVIETSYDKKPVKVVCDYGTVANGPNYMAKAVLDYPEKGVQVIVENFEHQRSGS
jgi:hypothetical protein